MRDTVHTLREAMTADEISQVQNEHYMLDDHIRRMTGRLTADQKRKIVEIMRSMMPTQG